MARRRSVSSAWRKLLRHIPGYDSFHGAEGYWFDPDAAQYAIDFFSNCLVHIKGAMAGQPFRLEPWQEALVACLFGWRDEHSGFRRYREAFIFVPRKNGKSLMAAGIATYLLFADQEPGAEIYCAAADREQAALVFEVAKQQVVRNEAFSEIAQPYRHSIVIPTTASALKVIAAEANTAHGFNSHGVIIDELHAQPDREFCDVLTTSIGSRKQPLIIYITTSDYDRPSICNEKHDYAIKVRDEIIPDSRFLPVIYEASKEDDWTSPSIWRKANPNYEVSVSEEFLERECLKARETPSFENTFKRMYLNIRTEQDVRWLSMTAWDQCGALDLSDLIGGPCYAGLDLAATKDITAFVLVFPDPERKRFHCVPHFFIPQDTAARREREDRVPYLTWARQGHVTLTPGEVTDYDFVRKHINTLRTKYNIQTIAYDPWNAQQLVNQLDQDGCKLIEFGQTFAKLNAPAKLLEQTIIAQNFSHGNNPVLRWMASNVVIQIDPSGNIRPSKKKSTEKIDGITATIMALALASTEEAKESVYNKRGLVSI